MASPNQMRWNGMVSRPGQTYISTAHTTAVTAHAQTRPRLRGGEPVSDITYRLDAVRAVELGPQAADAHVDEVAAGVEGQSPHVGEQLTAAARFAGPDHD